MHSYDGHLCVDGGDVLVRIIAPIKLGQRGRFEFLKDKLSSYLICKWMGVQHFHLTRGIGLLLALSNVVDIILQCLVIVA